MWQSAQLSRCRLISPSTDAESRPSKYQQIKWIVSLQLMVRSPSFPMTPIPSSKPKSKIYYLILNHMFTCCDVKRRNLGAFTFLKRLHVDWFKSAESRNMMLQRCGVTVISRKAWMRASSGGCVLKREDSVPLPKSGFTMQSAEVDGESAVVGIRWL